MKECLFCKIAAGEIPATKVYEDEQFVVFRDINPQAPTHVLIIPRRHIEKLTDLTESESGLIGQMQLLANKIAEQEGITSGGFRTVFNCGEGAGQSVWHIHMHLLGGRPMTWPPG
ncbi:MAG: HIT domain-containing protein [Actinobacteria bacterium]|nr:HIT domain-containing protein [Actinomycetota bacterium]